ncbi:DEAD/DEAH box helicase [Pseudovibrio ascidiaceicola]|uniref:DEAD/DEAH box helicase n=1 Tax=Pseudovibrio ascidiaceicola TaxID=285279 RepID=UPI000D68FF5D|nr:DEAD/DEAH box helicase family protein [Pseudovibrio ascidiaceicola]
MSFDKLSFQASWREYQERVLAELDTHLDDDHLHIVAAPGSGKTILGLEVIRRVDQPAVILAPTITIRNQWIERLTSLFLPEGEERPDWISKDIRNPRFLTVITYQALHAAFSNEDIDEELQDAEDEAEDQPKVIRSKSVDVIALLAEQNVNVLVLDEAHHLRNEWWKALIKLKAGLVKPKTVALTASPPYDVDFKEWQKYEELCGPIDAEISVPELVQRGDLCPHQDYVHFSLPTKDEHQKLWEFKKNTAGFLKELSENKRFLDALSAHPWVRDTQSHVKDILDDPQFFSSIIIFLNSLGFAPPDYALNILGVRAAEVPGVDPKWLEVLLSGVLYSYVDDFSEFDDTLVAVRRELKRIGAIERRRINLEDTKEIKKILASSTGKLKSIATITRMEARQLGDDLRMVVLADYIREAELPSGTDEISPLNKIGVAPIFEHLRRESIAGVKLGVLTGSLIILPKDALGIFDQVVRDNHIDNSHIRFSDLAHDKNFVRVHIKGEQKQSIVHLITEVFNAGGITALVGTQALLGEGWDAPSVNTLILASYVGSYMLSNQMRGRAIRIDPSKPNKTANIWHLASVDIERLDEKLKSVFTKEILRPEVFDPFDDIQQNVGDDVRMLQRRFLAFEGVSYEAPFTIENGSKRLALAGTKWTNAGVESLNQSMLARAKVRNALSHTWSNGLHGSSPKPEMRENVGSNYAPQGFVFFETIQYLIMTGLITAALAIAQILSGVRGVETLAIWILVGAGVAAVMIAPKAFKFFRLYLRNSSLEKSITQVGWSVLETLQFMEHIKTSTQNLRIQSTQNKMGVVYCRLDGATPAERRLFLEAMGEVLGPSENPRYLLVRSSRLGGISRVDYHPVPNSIGQKKKNAEFFAKRWERYIGPSQLIYTRSPEGRLSLLQARTQSFASVFQKKTDRLSVWE